MSLSRIEQLPTDLLRPSERNARTHSKKQIRQIADSIEAFGFTQPVLIDADNMILAGHGRIAAAKLLKLEHVPCIRIEHMSDAQKRAYVLADNKLALNAGWDEDLLALELEALADLDFDISLTGFSIPEVDELIAGLNPEEPGDPADDVTPQDAPARCAPGDIWALGQHRLICGDARDPATLKALLGRSVARMVFTDPPYNVPIQGNVAGSGATQYREFAMGSGEMSSTEFTAFLADAFRNMAAASRDGAIHFICMDWRHIDEVKAAAAGIYSELKNLIVWVKNNGGMGTFYRSRHELIFVFKVGTAEHINAFELGQHGRYRTNVWEHRGLNAGGAARLDELSLHPTVKPVEMIADAIRDVSRRGEIVLDVFGGSGSTLIAAQKTGRRAYLCEIDPLYCDRILARWEVYANDEAERIEAISARSPRRAA